ncbi:hypothetical protein SAMN06295900_10773 [Trinickia caryophylli]|uniref:Uncharacterized protein n=1 Tax=Trinickia caryophylli TaxID=28094 RepID=A0A1X7F2Y0_TRICW|nr:hypothetical protein C0Z17_20010 [Trinickia caryophylli]SMF44706.1 hypothetical protein SAMN06295900_10773 [Trinickia caryophylli]
MGGPRRHPTQSLKQASVIAGFESHVNFEAPLGCGVDNRRRSASQRAVSRLDNVGDLILQCANRYERCI